VVRSLQAILPSAARLTRSSKWHVTLVFLGEVIDDAGTRGFAFQDTASFVQHGSGLEGDEQDEEIVLYFLPESEIGALYDIDELTAEIAGAAQRAVSLNYPTLKPVR